MNRSNGEKVHDLNELVARALFQDQHKFQSWERSKLYLKANSMKRATEALRRAGIKNVTIETDIVDPKEGVK
jgi:hypothetical protein